MSDYLPRIVDAELDQLLDSLPALSLQGTKGIGKTKTALRRAATVYALDDEARREVLSADLGQLSAATPPVLIDEWQYVPEVWDKVRRAVDENPSPGRFLLTGSAALDQPRTHSGAGRIVTLRMRPMTLVERGVGRSSVSVGELLSGVKPPLHGETQVGLLDYAREIVTSGLPGVRRYSDRALRSQLDGYIDRIAEHDVEEAGVHIRKPALVKRWIAAYAAATSSTTSFEKIRAAAHAERGSVPARSTTESYRDALMRLWILDPVPAWIPTANNLSRLAASPKHHLADPALAAAALGIDVGALIDAQPAGPAELRDGPLLGKLFESLVTLCVRVDAQASEATVKHLRTKGGEREVDLIVERRDRRVVAIEVKLGQTVGDDDVRHLRWLADRIGPDLLDSIVVTTGSEAYRRTDGIGVVPLALLGP